MSFNIGAILNNEGAGRNDYFYVLGCNENSSEEQIITEYRIRALKCHPDKNPRDENALAEFQKLQEARDVLTDPELRRNFDKWRNSEMCIPFKTWLSMNQRCTTTMHWAKPKEQTMLEGPGNSHLGPDSYPNATAGNLTDLSRSNRRAWESDTTSNVYKEFRNYKI